jgi:hypothetical protein
MRQVMLKDVPRGEFIRRAEGAKATYRKGEYDHSSKRYALDDWSDINRTIYAKGTALVWVGFDF